jgi:hypothetical protein
MQVPGEGVHAHRLGGLATFDVALTLLAAIAIAMFWSRQTSGAPFGGALVVSTVALFATGVLAHVALGIPTALNKFIGVA